MEFVFRIDNSGPSDAHGVVLSDDLPPRVAFVSATLSQGTFVVTNSTLRCDLGTVPGGSNAIVSARVNTGLIAGVVTNYAQVKRDEVELYSANDSVVLTTTIVPQPLITIDDVSVLEGDSGMTNAVFLVRLSGPSSQSVSVDYATADGTAHAGSEYVSASGTLEFPPGVTLQKLPVQVSGDQIDEPDQSFYVNLSAPRNAILSRARATGTIIDDDGPEIMIADASVLEGNKGTTNCLFYVLLRHPSPQTVYVDYLTSDGSAIAPADYEENYGTLEFAPGDTYQTISVVVKGDTIIEPNERFYVNLLNPVNATLSRKQAIGTIFNDDGIPGQIDHFEWDPIPSPQVVNQPFPVTVSARDAFDVLVTNFNGTVTLSGEIDHPEVAIGAGQMGWSEPLATYYEDARTQIIYLASELGGPRRITGLALNITYAPSMTLNRWTIRLKHTTLSRYDTGAVWQSSGWTVAYQANETLASTGWTTFQFKTPFEYDGVSNLLIDFSYNNSDYDFDEGECAATDTTEPRALWGVADGDHGDPLNWNGQTAQPETRRSILNLRLFWRDSISVTPTVANGFAQGVWTGPLTVQELASGMVLRADDGAHLGQSGPFSTSLVDDLSVAVSASPSPITVGRQLTYSITAQNSGPAVATGVVISNRWPDSAMLLSASSTQGAWRIEDGAVVFEIGTLPGGSNAVASVVVSPSVSSIQTNRVSITRLEPDSYAGNNSVVLLTPAYSPPGILVSDVSVLEGNTGFTFTNFTVRLSNPSSDPVSVEFSMADGTANAGSDYISTNGVVTFPPGNVTQTIPVQIIGDTLDEDDEVFYLNLANPVNGALLVNQAACRILDDDGPAILINRVSVLEGDSGTNAAIFTVRLTAPSPQPITVRYATADETATAGSDYVDASGTITFPPGTTTQSLGISIIGDILVEPDETFVVNLSDPTNATVQVSSGIGTILNDDGLPGQLDHFEWSAVSSPQYANQPFPVILWAKDGANQTVTNFTDTAALQGQVVYPETTIGNDDSSWEAPFNISYELVRVQAIYLASEIGPARPISSLALNVTEVPALPLHRWTIRMRHTSLSAYPNVAAWERSGWATVYQSNQTIETRGWITFPLSPPFLFNGTNHLMVDFSFMNTNLAFSSGSCAASDTTEARSLSQAYYFWGVDPLAWTGQSPAPDVSYQVPDIRLTSVESIPIQPTNSGRFIEGQWTGSLVVAKAAANLVLRAIDSVGHSGTSTPFQIQPWVDTDGDGLPDDWELGHQLAATDATDGNADGDGDGLTNLQEFAAGTDPRDAQSTLRIWTAVSGPGEVLLSFATVAGKVYQLESSHDLGSGVWQEVGQPFPGTGQVVQITSSMAPEQCAFFRLHLGQ